MKIKKSVFFVLFCAVVLFCSCSKSLGYSVLLWDIPENKLQDGQLLKVYYKSNITQKYIVGLPNGKERYEVPFWKLIEPSSKKKVLEKYSPYLEYSHQYGKIKVDGLPVRESPVNTAKQVYRLYQNEVVKILYKGEGQDVMVGKNKKLPGDWLCILTEGGSMGWCFSYNMTLFETAADGSVIGDEVTEEVQVSNDDSLIDQILNAKWYPEYYKKLLDENMIDLQSVKLAYGFDTGIKSGKIQVNLPEKYLSRKYSGVEKIRDNTYVLKGTPFQIIIRNKEHIIVNYSPANGEQEVFSFITLSEDVNISKLIENEKKRRNNLMNELYKITSFNSENYGKIVFNSGNTFTWDNFSLLVPSLISSSAKNRGTVNITYLMDKKFENNYNGVLTFKFEGMEDRVSFLYKIDSDGLRIESLDSYSIKDNIVVSRSSSPTVMFFTK